MSTVNHAALKRCTHPDHEGPNPNPTSEFSPVGRKTERQRRLHSHCRICRARVGREGRRVAAERKYSPCLVCGHETAAPNGICQRTAACRREYARLDRQQYPGRQGEYTLQYRLRKDPERQQRLDAAAALAHPCASCGQVTTSELPVCSRRSCVNEYRRVERAVSQRARGASVYGIWFPAAHVLKVGFTTHVNNSPFMSSVRTRAERHGLDTTGASCIWKHPGDVRTEAWIQATLAFRWAAAFEQKHTRMCEWFAVPVLSGYEVVAVLDHVHSSVPRDLMENAAA